MRIKPGWVNHIQLIINKVSSDVNKDWTTKDQDKDQGQTFKDKDWPHLIFKD